MGIGRALMTRFGSGRFHAGHKIVPPDVAKNERREPGTADQKQPHSALRGKHGSTEQHRPNEVKGGMPLACPLDFGRVLRSWYQTVSGGRLARVTLPIWLYVSVSSVLVYVLLYHSGR